MAHDPLSSYDLVHDEIAQRRETGHDVGWADAALALLDPADGAALEKLYLRVCAALRNPDWSYHEPDTLEGILATLPEEGSLRPVTERFTRDELYRRILGGWLGRIAGNNLGKPVENGDHWTPTHLREYLELAGAYPLDDYIPVLDPMPERFELLDNWPRTTRGRITVADRDDDIDYSIMAVHLLGKHGAALTTADVADDWLGLLPYRQVFTAEAAVYKNMLHGVPLVELAHHRNPYREWIGALIRGDAFGWTHPGHPRGAAVLAYRDASLSHTGNGIYGEMWSAAMVSAAFTATSPREVLETSLRHVPPGSRLAEAVRAVLAFHGAGHSWDEALVEIRHRFGQYSWVHTVNNAAVIAAGLLWGDGDYATTVGLTVQGGWDTDSTAATAGSVVGVMLGAEALPTRFIEPLHNRTRSALFGFDNSVISDLAECTTDLAYSALSTGAGSGAQGVSTALTQELSATASSAAA